MENLFAAQHTTQLSEIDVVPLGSMEKRRINEYWINESLVEFDCEKERLASSLRYD